MTTTIRSWPYQRTDCQYIHRLYAALDEVAGEPIEASDYRPGRVWKPAPDFLHLHWPETAVDNPFYPRALLRAVVVLIDIVWMKLRGSTVVWTRHDDGSHSQTHPKTERFFAGLYERLTDAFIHLTEGSQRHFAEGNDRQLHRVIRHGIGPIGTIGSEDRRVAKRSVGLDDAPVIGIVGRLQEYKNVVETIDAFAELGYGQLLIAGEPIGEGYGEQLRKRDGLEGLCLKLGRLTEREFADCLAACDVVILLYSNHLNSGVAFEAIAAPSRIAVTGSPSMGELVEEAGPDWVRLVETPPTPELLADLISWAGEPQRSESKLHDTWSEVAGETWEFLQQLR